jgi:ribose 5-phosphate isomerase B
MKDKQMADAVKTIALGTDHAGYKYKELLKKHLSDKGFEVKDFGTFSPDACDYPDFVRPAAQAVASGQADAGVVFGGSGNGEAMVANKVKGIRCAVCWNLDTAKLAKTHNNANVISIGERTITPEMLIQIVDTWLAAGFEGGRHARRVEKIEKL